MSWIDQEHNFKFITILLDKHEAILSQEREQHEQVVGKKINDLQGTIHSRPILFTSD